MNYPVQALSKIGVFKLFVTLEKKFRQIVHFGKLTYCINYIFFVQLNLFQRWFNICDALCELVTLLHGCFSCFLSCANGTKLRKASHLTLQYCRKNELLTTNNNAKQVEINRRRTHLMISEKLRRGKIKVKNTNS